MDSLKRYWYWLLVLAFILGLAIRFQSFVSAYIIEPIAVLLWMVWSLVSTVSQDIYWLILITVCSIFIARFIPLPKRSVPPAYSYKYLARNRVEYWQALLTAFMLREKDAAALQPEFEQLIHSLLSLSREASAADVHQMISDGRIALSPQAKSFLFPSNEQQKPTTKFQQLCSRFLTANWLPKRMRSIKPDTTVISEILAWMEHDLEIKHE